MKSTHPWGILGLLLLCLALTTALFPPVNWPDEHRNLGLLEDTDYGLIYGRVQHASRDFVGAMLPGPRTFDAAAAGVAQDNHWKMASGALRYRATGQAVPPVYYWAKITNILMVLAFIGGFFLVARMTSAGDVARRKLSHYLLALMTPAVCYQLLQVSTDLLFLLVSVGLYFVESRKALFGYGVLCALLIVEDRSFALLAATAMSMAVLPSLLPWGFVSRHPGRRAGLLLAIAASAFVIGTILGKLFLSGAVGAIAVSGFDKVAEQLAYTQGKSFNPMISPAIMYMGLIYLPGATEFALATVPLYVLVSLVFIRFLQIAIVDRSETGERFFYLSCSVLGVFFAVTNATHVFEAGRYYFSLMPALVLASLSLIRQQPERYATHGVATMQLAVLLAGVNVVLTLLIAVPTFF